MVMLFVSPPLVPMPKRREVTRPPARMVTLLLSPATPTFNDWLAPNTMEEFVPETVILLLLALASTPISQVFVPAPFSCDT